MASIYGFNKGEKGNGKHIGADLELINDEIMSEFDYFTFQDVFTNQFKRVRGVYNLGDAIGILDDQTESNYSIRIKFTKNTQEVRLLHNLIRAGKTWPDICYEDPHVPAPCRHLKDIWHEAIGIIRREVIKKRHFM